ncbi:phospholipase A and acyltransferase 3-like [Littorina saxatilis]|uniref:LRAT domain-containing protein n=1 Tax=Littorina saxatilis TaxID=31220 RepID=A0AAN9FZI1_9CAEN
MVTPKKGDIIRFQRKGYSHFAIYIGDGKVIHRTSPPDSLNVQSASATAVGQSKNAAAIIRIDDLKDVAGDESKAHIANSLDDQKKPFDPEEIVKRAKSKLGEKGYNLFFKNCEHFVMWCRYGIEKSEQVEQFVDALMRGPLFIIDQLAEYQKTRREVGYY